MHSAEEDGGDKVVKGEENFSKDAEIDAEGDQKDDKKEELSAQEEKADDFLCMPCEDPEGIDEGVEVEAEMQRAAADPGQPTRAQREEHDLTHFPFRSWCRACVMGRAKDAPSNKVKALFAETILPRVRMDYCFLTEDVDRTVGEDGEGEAERVGTSITTVVMQESLCKSVWSYAVESKGSTE